MSVDAKTIVIFSWFYLPHVGGAELFVREIVSRLSHRYRFVIVTARLDRTLSRRETDHGAEVIRVGAGAAIDKALYPVPALWSALRARNVGLVHAVMVNASALTAYLYRTLKPTPSLLTLQSGDSEEYAKSYLGPLFPIYPWLHRPFDRIHAISRHLESEAVRFGADPARISLVPNGVDTSLFSRGAHPPEEIHALRERLGLVGKRVVVSASRLGHTQGLEDLLRAVPAIAAAHPDAVVLLLGDGENRSHLMHVSAELGIDDRVQFLGTLDPPAVAKHLCLTDVFVRPSKIEGLGTAFLEALACEVPIVGTRVGGIPDFLEHESNGLFVETGNPASVAEAVNRFLEDSNLARGCGARGRDMVVKDYRWDAVAERIGDLYDELLAG